jgi:hypothetical protein
MLAYGKLTLQKVRGDNNYYYTQSIHFILLYSLMKDDVTYLVSPGTSNLYRLKKRNVLVLSPYKKCEKYNKMLFRYRKISRMSA